MSSVAGHHHKVGVVVEAVVQAPPSPTVDCFVVGRAVELEHPVLSVSMSIAGTLSGGYVELEHACQSIMSPIFSNVVRIYTLNVGGVRVPTTK